MSAETWTPTGRLRFITRGVRNSLGEHIGCVKDLQQEFVQHPFVGTRLAPRLEWRDVPQVEERLADETADNEREALVRAMAEMVVGKDAGAADLALAESLAQTATSITHECGTPQATAEAIAVTIANFLRHAAQNLLRKP
jgi:hypothetical protein